MNLLERRLADQTGLPDLTLLSNFAPVQGFVTFRQTFAHRSQNCDGVLLRFEEMSGGPRPIVLAEVLLALAKELIPLPDTITEEELRLQAEVELQQLRAEVQALRGAIGTTAEELAPYAGNGTGR